MSSVSFKDGGGEINKKISGYEGPIYNTLLRKSWVKL